MADAKPTAKPKPKRKPKPKKPPLPTFDYGEALACVNKVPTDDRTVADAVCRELAAGGAERIAQLVGIVGEPGDERGIRPRYALHGLVGYCSRPEAEAERKTLAGALATELGGKHSPEVKDFLLEQLRLCGTPAEVPAIARLLRDQRLGLPAIAALASIGDETAVKALRDGLAASAGRHRVGILQALGRLRDKDCVAAVMKDAGSKERDVHLAAIYALANIGDPAAIDAVKAAAKAESYYERTQGVDACLLLARRLAEQEKTDEAKAVYRHVLGACTAEDEEHFRRAAKAGLDALAR